MTNANTAKAKQAPAYQIYASDLIADRRYRLMTLKERGMLLTMLNECWVNRDLPFDHEQLSKLLGFSNTEIQSALSDYVLSFFNHVGKVLVNPELQSYQAKLDARRDSQSKGGKKSAEKSKSKKSMPSDEKLSALGSEHASELGSSREEQKRLEQIKTDRNCKGGYLSEGNKEWVSSYNETEANEYAALSNGE